VPAFPREIRADHSRLAALACALVSAAHVRRGVIELGEQLHHHTDRADIRRILDIVADVLEQRRIQP